MGSEFPPEADPQKIIDDPEAHFSEPQQGWYKLWYKPETAGYWCALRVGAAVALKRVRQLTERGAVRFLTVEKIPFQTYSRPSQRWQRLLTGRGF